MAKWYTFAPCRFPGTVAFFGRDSGLLCRGLQQLGHESKVIMPGPAFEGDLPGILRGTPQELESADWWRALKLDGVIMVAWARHRETPMVRAIAASGTPLVIHIDGGGNPFPFSQQIETIKTIWRAEHDPHPAWIMRGLFSLKNYVLRSVLFLFRHSYLKFKHLQYATVVTLQSPSSLEGHRWLCSFFGGKNHGVDLRLAGMPIFPNFVRNPAIAKEKRIVAIGRWEDLIYKRPYVLMAVSESIARKRPDLHIDIFGTKTEALNRWHLALEPSVSERIHLHGEQPRDVVSDTVQRAQIYFFPSSSESGPMAMYESLACGTSAVAIDSPYLPGARWAAQTHHADLALRDTTEDYVAALERGLEKWERGEYTAQQISEYWIPRTRPQHVLEIMLNAVEEKQRASHSTASASRS